MTLRLATTSTLRSAIAPVYPRLALAQPIASSSRLLLAPTPRPPQRNLSSTPQPPQHHFSSNPQPPQLGLISSTHHFDTHALLTRLESAGMPPGQANTLVAAINDVVTETMSHLEKGSVSREESEKWRYAQKIDFNRLKSEVQIQERSDFNLMKAENDRLLGEVEKLKQRLKEEVTRTTAGVRLDLNLEKGRIRDESSIHFFKISEVEARIESELAGLRTNIEGAKFNVLQYLVGVATGAAALLLAFARFVT